MSLVSVIFCLGVRLPSLMIFLDPPDTGMLLEVACDAVCALFLFCCALDTAGKEY